MAFPSQFATKLWDKLYDVLVPDQMTLDAGYIKKFGTYVTGNKKVDEMLSRSKTHVKIPVIKVLEYWEDGMEVEILSREDMIQMHKDMEGYLAEWRDHLKYAVNNDLHGHKDLILSLEKLSKHIFERAKPKEIVDNLFKKQTFGIVNPLAKNEEEKRTIEKPDYEGISRLVRSKSGTPPTGRF